MATMTDYVAESSLGWLDFDHAASERIGEMIRALDEPDTLDVLGLGTVRDAFSAMLHPGTSTIQTRLRYFMFVPWICARLETQRVAPAGFRRKLRDAEAQLIGCLQHLGPNEGVIGYTAGRNLKRMPSEAYWGGLRSWGLRKLNLSISEYGQRAAALGKHQPHRDDDKNVTTRTVSMWAELPSPPSDFLQGDITLDLTSEEAQLLVDHIRRRHAGTLLAELCAMPGAAAKADYPWKLRTQGMPGQLAELLRHARNFSELTVGPQHLYNVLLARQARSELGWDTEGLERDELNRLHSWASGISQRLDDVRAWAADLPSFWALLVDFDISPGAQEFINSMVGRIAADPEGFAEDPAVHEMIRRRELRLKSKRARLTHRFALERWNGAGFGGQFDFRWRIVQSYMRDIAEALGEST